MKKRTLLLLISIPLLISISQGQTNRMVMSLADPGLRKGDELVLTFELSEDDEIDDWISTGPQAEGVIRRWDTKEGLNAMESISMKYEGVTYESGKLEIYVLPRLPYQEKGSWITLATHKIGETKSHYLVLEQYFPIEVDSPLDVNNQKFKESGLSLEVVLKESSLKMLIESPDEPFSQGMEVWACKKVYQLSPVDPFMDSISLNKEFFMNLPDEPVSIPDISPLFK